VGRTPVVKAQKRRGGGGGGRTWGAALTARGGRERFSGVCIFSERGGETLPVYHCE
jgi:hypothetical protein